MSLNLKRFRGPEIRLSQGHAIIFVRPAIHMYIYGIYASQLRFLMITHGTVGSLPDFLRCPHGGYRRGDVLMASHSIGSRYQPHFYQVPATSMLLEAVRNLSVSELLRALNEKLGLECTRIRNISTSHTVPAASLKSEVSIRLPTPVPWAQRWGLTPVCHTDRKSRSQNTRCSKVHPLFTEHVAASQQVVTGDPFSYRSTLSR